MGESAGDVLPVDVTENNLFVPAIAPSSDNSSSDQQCCPEQAVPWPAPEQALAPDRWEVLED